MVNRWVLWIGRSGCIFCGKPDSLFPENAPKRVELGGCWLNCFRTVILVAMFGVVILGASSAGAVDAVNVRPEAGAIDLTDVIDRQHTDSDKIQVSTAPGPDGVVLRIEVRAREGSNNWAVFALANNSEEQLERLIVVPHYRMVGSGILWPDLGLSRLVNITPSSGEKPEDSCSPPTNGGGAAPNRGCSAY